MRSSRLVALLLELGRTPVATASQLAAHHGVNVRTIERDVAALQSMGVPLWTRPGPGGGVGLVKGWRSPLTGLTVPELQALIIGEAGSRGLGLEAEFQMARLRRSSPFRRGSCSTMRPGSPSLSTPVHFPRWLRPYGPVTGCGSVTSAAREAP